MSTRTPLRDVNPAIAAAQTAHQPNLVAFNQAKHNLRIAELTRNNLIQPGAATQAAVDQAATDLQAARANFNTAEAAYNITKTALDDLLDSRAQREAYLQERKDDRDPVHQVETLPAACSIDLETLLAYDIEEFNALLEDSAKPGQFYWEFHVPAAITTNDASLRRTIHQVKSRREIKYKTWIKHTEAFGTIFDTLDQAGFGTTRHVKP